ncbi:hypothetical protein INT48_007397 [Thamnidium elegans]|uniref:Uncharacterized protein n=1 Tax=Thamnidium elegans TaxID=101142 RepID=A0A8H7SL25_9FUNG|nr:hypothetical protein INT48_007397 [Thamnidium elegans]
MSFEFDIKALIAKATKEYEVIATNVPMKSSKEDGTTRGFELDFILSEQETERKQLWDKLYELEDKRIEKGKNKAIGEPIPTNRKELLKLITLDKQIVEKVEDEMSKLNIHEALDDTLLELKYRERLEAQVKQFEKAIESLERQVEQVKAAIAREKRAITECDEIKVDLLVSEQNLKTEIQVKETSADRLRAELVLLQKKYEVDIKEMSDFLDEHYPVHVVDGAGPLGDECDLKILLEQLLNEAYRHPENPYLPLRRGEYWSPYVETLIKGGIASYHPEDANLLCLENFRLS